MFAVASRRCYEAFAEAAPSHYNASLAIGTSGRCYQVPLELPEAGTLATPLQAPTLPVDATSHPRVTVPVAVLLIQNVRPLLGFATAVTR